MGSAIRGDTMLFTKSIKYPVTFNLVSGSTDLDEDVTSINRCIGLILTTGKGELLGDPDFGCRLYELLFNQFSRTFEEEVKTEIVKAITAYESRVIVNTDGIEITHLENTDRNSYRIQISYNLKNTSKFSKTEITVEEENDNA